MCLCVCVCTQTHKHKHKHTKTQTEPYFCAGRLEKRQVPRTSPRVDVYLCAHTHTHKHKHTNTNTTQTHRTSEIPPTCIGRTREIGDLCYIIIAKIHTTLRNLLLLNRAGGQAVVRVGPKHARGPYSLFSGRILTYKKSRPTREARTREIGDLIWQKTTQHKIPQLCGTIE